MRSIDYVMNALNDNDSEEAAKRAMEQAAASRRASGSVGRIGSSSPSIDANMLKMARESNAAAPAVDNDYLGVAEEARDDGSHAPEAAKAYLAYQNDPQYQQLETAKRLAMEKMSGAGAGMLNRITHGGHLESARSTYEMAERSQKMIQQRYLDNLRATLASQPTPEDFPDKPSVQQRWNPDKHYYEDVFVGERGTERGVRTAAPRISAVDQYGRQITRDVIPGGKFMVDKSPEAIAAESAAAEKKFGVSKGGEFVDDRGLPTADMGGVAAVEPQMEELRQDPKTQSEIDENRAQKGAADALAEGRGVVEVSPGGSVFDTKSKKKLFTAPLTPSQANAGGAGNVVGNKPARSMSLEEIEKAARDEANAKVPEALRYGPDGAAKWESARASAAERMHKQNMAVSGIKINGNGPEVGTIRNGYKFLGGRPNDKKNWEKVGGQ